MKFQYFESEWESRPDWIVNGKAEVRKLWESEYKPPPATSEEQRLRVVHYIRAPTPSSPGPNSSSSSFTNINYTSGSGHSSVSHIPDWQRRKRQRLISDNCDDLDRYLRRNVEYELPLGPLKYWINHAEDLRQKDISKMAIDIFSIPAMSADPEWLFSR